jgi:hypothetical protein
MTLGDNVEAPALARDVATEVTTSVATEPVDPNPQPSHESDADFHTPPLKYRAAHNWCIKRDSQAIYSGPLPGGNGVGDQDAVG